MQDLRGEVLRNLCEGKSLDATSSWSTTWRVYTAISRYTAGRSEP
jgi:hypothetical protein